MLIDKLPECAPFQIVTKNIVLIMKLTLADTQLQGPTIRVACISLLVSRLRLVLTGH